MFLVYYDILQKNEQALYRTNDLKQRNIVLHSFFENRRNSMIRIADDYSLWDDIVHCIKTNDINWANEYIQPILTIHGYDTVWVFDKKQKMIYHSSSKQEYDIRFEEEVFHQIYEQRLSYFFYPAADNIIEIAAATIHPTNDNNRETEPAGYFLFGKIFHSAYLSELENQTDYTIQSIPIGKRNDYQPKKNELQIDIPLFNHQRNPVQILCFSQQNIFFSTLLEIHRKSLLILSIFTFLFLTGLYLLFHFWIKKPLVLIADSLQTGTLTKIQKFVPKNNEFGNISKMIIRYFQQAETLKNEMEARLAAKQKLIETTDRFYKIFEHSPDLIMIIFEHNIVEVNKTFLQQTGFSEQHLIGKKVSEIALFPDNFEQHGSSEQNHLQLTANSGHKIDVVIFCETIDFELKKCQLYMMRNITEELKREKQMIQTQKLEAIRSLASGIAHDFNNILNVILGYTASLKATSIINTEQFEKLQLIENASHRAHDLVEQIVLISKQHEQILQAVKMNSIITQALKFLHSFIPSTINLVTNLHSESCILADPMQIHQIIINLCTNAFQAIYPQKGTIEISLSDTTWQSGKEAQSPQICLKIKDTGCGIPTEIIDRIFDPYFSTKDVHQGFGLGLAIVKGIVESINGTIQVESQLHTGTTFTVFIPVYHVEPKQIVKNHVPEKCEHKTVLFVEDDSELLAMFQESLWDANLEVIAVNESRKALDIFLEQQNQIDIVVTDAAMPRLSGIELIRHIRNYNSDIPIILYSGFKTVEMENSLKTLNIFAFLLKPIIPAKMVQIISKALYAKR
jgi:PAS domain S-box-containing protein